ncbi:8230_t:CDS:2, partial [Funneliformis geosporum]
SLVINNLTIICLPHRTIMDNDFIRSAKRALSALLESARGETESKNISEEISEPRAKQVKLFQNEDDSTSPNKPKVFYNPIDKNDFMRRLATFMISFLLSFFPVECARYGWINISEDFLKCEYCGEQMLEKMTVQYHEGLSSAHASTCPWRERHCDDFIYKISLSLDRSLLKEFQTRALPLIQLGDKLPVIKVEVTEEYVKLIISVMSNEVKNIGQDILTSASCLSLFGWEYELIEGLEMLKCPYCFRQCSLSNYLNIAKHREIQQKQDKENLQDDESDKNEQNTQDIETDLTFDIANEHRWYCAWIAGNGTPIEYETSDEQMKQKAGWQITLNGIANCSFLFSPKDASVELVDFRLNELRDNLSPFKKITR